MKIRKRLFLFVASFFICFSNIGSAYVRADAASLELVVEGLGAGGLAGTAAVASLGPVGAALLALLGVTAGISIYLTEESKNDGLTNTQYLSDQFGSWVTYTGNDLEQEWKDFLSEVQVTADGTILFWQGALDKAKQFFNWVVSGVGDNFSTTVSGTPSVERPYAIINGNRFLYGNYLSMPRKAGVSSAYGNEYYYTSANDCFIYLRPGNALYFISKAPFTVTRVIVAANGSTSSTVSNSQGVFSGSDMAAATIGYPLSTYFEYPADLPSYSAAPGTFFDNHYFSDIDIIDPNSPTVDSFVGDPAEWADFVPGLSLPEGYTGAIDPGVLQGLEDAITDVGDYTIAMEKYIEALIEAVDGADGADIPVVDTADGLPVSVPVPDIADPAFDTVPPAEIPAEADRTDIIDTEKAASADSVISGLAFDLRDIFPFCIPFDIYALLQKFVAAPVAPTIHIDWDVPFIQENFVIDLDFSDYNSLMSVIRTMELVLAVVGLAIATRRIYLRG